MERGKKPSHRVGLPAIGVLLKYAPDLGNEGILNMVVDVLRGKGITVTGFGKVELRSFLEECSWG